LALPLAAFAAPQNAKQASANPNKTLVDRYCVTCHNQKLKTATLALDKDKGLKIRPEHIHEALRELAGIATHAHAKKFPLGLKDTEKVKGLWG